MKIVKKIWKNLKLKWETIRMAYSMVKNSRKLSESYLEDFIGVKSDEICGSKK